VSESRVLRIIFGPKRDEVTGEWRKLHNEELNDLYCSPAIVRVIKWRSMRWAWHVARLGERRGVCRDLVGTRERKRPLGRHKHRGECNIKMYFKGLVGEAWTGLSWLRIGTGGGRVRKLMNLRVL
jgi:hypothetical protein